MKELVFKKRSDLEDICRRTHLIPEEDAATEAVIEAMKSGNYLYSTDFMVNQLTRFGVSINFVIV